MTEYYGALNGLWIELDQYQNLEMICNVDTATLTQFIERMRIFNILFGLNFEPTRVQILGEEKLPSLSEVIYSVRGEESKINDVGRG